MPGWETLEVSKQKIPSPGLLSIREREVLLDLQDPGSRLTGPLAAIYRQVIIYYHYVEFKFLLVSKDFHRHSTTSDNIGNQMHTAAFTEIGNKMTIKYILFV